MRPGFATGFIGPPTKPRVRANKNEACVLDRFEPVATQKVFDRDIYAGLRHSRLWWIGAALVLIIGNAELRQHIFQIFSYLWLWLGLIPLCGFGVFGLGGHC